MPLVKNKEASSRLANYIGYKIFELRLIKGFKQTEMAAVLSLSRTQMNNIEAGRSGVSAEVMYNIRKPKSSNRIKAETSL